MRIVIADDHGIVRSGIRLLLERQPDLDVIAEAADGIEARDVVVRERPDLAILDVKMPGLTGLQATREIKSQAPEVSILILSMHDDERYLFEALKAGASGYVLKSQADIDLLSAIRSVERGEPFADRFDVDGGLGCFAHAPTPSRERVLGGPPPAAAPSLTQPTTSIATLLLS